MQRSRQPRDVGPAFEAFRVDPSWYDEHWLTEQPPAPPGSVARIARAAAVHLCAVLRRATLPRWSRPGTRLIPRY